MLSADPSLARLVTPPPGPNRVLVGALLAGVLLGGVGLVSVATGLGDPNPGAQEISVATLAGFGAALALVAVGIASLRRRQRDARPLVGAGSPRPVRLLPLLSARWVPLLWFAVQPTDGGPPLGRILLSRVDDGFDPQATFLAWGPHRIGEVVALTSTDGRQLVLPTSDLLAVEAGPAPDPDLTALVGRLVAWPPAPATTTPDLAAVDRGVAEWRRRLRITGPAIAVLPPGLVAIVAGTSSALDGRDAVLAFSVVVVAAGLVAERTCRAPVIDAVADRAREAGVPAARAARVLLEIRHPARAGTVDAPHGVTAGADGAGWNPTPPPR